MRIIKYLKRVIISVIILFVLTSLSFIFREYFSNLYVHLQLPDEEIPGAEARLLVVAPHNDDEVLGAGELISRTLNNGGKVKVVLITNGDGYRNAVAFDYKKLDIKPSDYVKFGYRRQEESRQALEALGLTAENIIFLGYPDGGMSQLWENYWSGDKLFLDTFTRVDHSPYENSMTIKAPYCGEAVAADLTQIIKDFQPTHIACPHPNDSHRDHWATYNFVKYAECVLDYGIAREMLYLVHQGDWPTPMGLKPDLYLVPPAQLIGNGTEWRRMSLAPEEITAKGQAIELYKSQIGILGRLLHSFVRKNELFGEYPTGTLYRSEEGKNDGQPAEQSRVITAPAHYYYRTQADKNAAISAVYAELAPQGRLSVSVAVAGKLEPNVTFYLNFIFFDQGNARHLHMAAKNGVIESVLLAGSPLRDSGSIEVNGKGNLLRVTIPPEMTGGYSKLFLSASTSLGSFRMDQTAWRLLDSAVKE